MDVRELRKEAANLLAEAQDIIELASTEGRIPNAEEQGDIDRLTAEASGLEQHIAQAEQHRILTDQRDKIAAIQQRFQQHPVAQETLSRPAPSRVSQMKVLWEQDPKKGYANHREFLMDVMKAAMTGRESVQLQYLKLRSAAGSDEQSTFSDPYGGYLVPIGFSPTMLMVSAETDPIAGRTTQIPMNVPMLNIPARVDKDHSTSVSGGLRVYRRAEADTVTASRMQFEQVTLRANALMGISYATEELLTDSPQSFIAILTAGFRDEFDSRILDERLNGTGVGEFLGVMKSPALIAVAREVAGEISYVDILNMMARCWRYQNAVWLTNHNVIPELGQMALTVGAGGSAIFTQNAALELPSTLMGRPVFYSEYMQPLGTLGDILLVNWSQYLEATYQPLQSAESIHVRFVNNERTFRFTARNDGAPWWRSALTPRNSAPTLSPYVALAA